MAEGRRGHLQTVATILLALVVLWQSADAQDRRGTRRGRVRGDRHAFVDDGGPFLARGASLFWGLWGYQHDRERLGRNLATLRDWGFDYIRVLGVVGAPGHRPEDSWWDRSVNPAERSYDEEVAAFTDWTYREYGLRVQWTIFGGTELAPTPDARRALVERFGDMSRGREEKIFAFEIANEAWQNGFPGDQGRRELHALARALKARTPVLVALSAPQGSSCDLAQALYRDSAADLMTLHLSRAAADNGPVWKTFGEPWSFQTCSGVPMLASSNEPIGPEASVASLDDPTALSALALVTYGSGIGAFVMHTGPGVRGGGAADRARGRHGNLWELPAGSRISGGLANVVGSLPGDFANWSKADVLTGARDRLFDVADQTALTGMYCFTSESAYACVPFGIRQPVQLIARRSLSASVRQLVNGTKTPTRRLPSGGRLSLPSAPAAALILGRVE